MCRDVNKIVKKFGFYTNPEDGSTPNVQESACSGEEGCKNLKNLELADLVTAAPGLPLEFNITLQRVLPAPGEVDPPVPEELEFGPFHLHEDGLTSWYHIGVDTTGLPLGQYSAKINYFAPIEDPVPRLLRDYNNLLLNPSTGNYVPATFLETIPSGSLIPDFNGLPATFLFDIVEAPPS